MRRSEGVDWEWVWRNLGTGNRRDLEVEARMSASAPTPAVCGFASKLSSPQVDVHLASQHKLTCALSLEPDDAG